MFLCVSILFLLFRNIFFCGECATSLFPLDRNKHLHPYVANQGRQDDIMAQSWAVDRHLGGVPIRFTNLAQQFTHQNTILII